MRLYDALRKHDLVDAFRAIATPETSSDDVLAWCKQQPALARTHWPLTLRDVRRKLNCPAARGGNRGTRGKPFMSVRKGGEKILQP